jgi:CRISPR system Cascade subunit CasE
MLTKAATLRMTRLHLSLPSLIELGRRRRLPIRDVDEGYLVHCLLGELFGDDAPSPFALVGRHGRAVEVLAYTERSELELRRHAREFAATVAQDACDWSRMAQKELPDCWPPGSRLAFRTRVCPVVRVARGSEHYRPGAEVDAFLALCSEVGEGVQVDRQSVYRQWFRDQIERTGGAQVLSTRLEAFRFERLVRRTQGTQREAKIKQRPDATIAGELKVTDSARFSALLRRGIGRHRAFGFGMLLLSKPAS